MKYFSLILKITIVSLLFISCSSSDDDDDEVIIDPIPTGMTYTKDIKTVTDNNCNVSGCHNTATMAAGFALSNYEEVKDAFMNKGALSQVESGNMPKNGSKLSQTTINKIKGWIAEEYNE